MSVRAESHAIMIAAGNEMTSVTATRFSVLTRAVAMPGCAKAFVHAEKPNDERMSVPSTMKLP